MFRSHDHHNLKHSVNYFVMLTLVLWQHVCNVVSRGSWRLTGHQFYTPLDHVHAFLLVGLVCLQRWERKVSVT